MLNYLGLDEFSIRTRRERAFVRKIIVFLLATCGITASALAQGLPGDWIGQMNGGFKVRIHFERAGSGFSGKLINPSRNETGLDDVRRDASAFCCEQTQLELRRRQ